MSDFDAVLERLVVDQAFAAALAADPAGALAGYRLDADELALLQMQVGGDPGGQHGVEVRANQSSMFGMLTPLAGMAGALPGCTDLGTSGMGPAAGASQGFGAAPGAAAGLGRADGQPSGGLAGLGGEIGAAITAAQDAAVAAANGGLAGALASGEAGFGSADGPVEAAVVPPPPAEVAPPQGYRTRVDVDGDGDWDRHTLHGRADGGVDILVDLNRDGRADFVGHDLDADGLVDVSEYDKDRDGFFEKRMYDDNGDGWMDRTVRAERPPGQAR